MLVGLAWLAGLGAAEARRNYGFARNPNFEPATSIPRLRTSSRGNAAKTLPRSFDWRNIDGVNYAVADVQQHAPVYCGSCWVHAVVAMLNDRLKIARRAAFPDVMLARQVLINCAPKSTNGSLNVGFNGCDGGDERDIYVALLQRENWLPDETCQPYEARNRSCDALHTCTNCMPTDDGGSNCFEVPAFTTYGISSWRAITTPQMGAAEREAAIQEEIFAAGPVVCNFAAIPEFDENYTAVAQQHGGVYRTAANVTSDDINHDIVLAGWGITQGGVKFWVGRNSWGTFWGDNGWFRIERGVNALLIEGACTSAVPTFDALDDELDGAQGGGPLGLAQISPKGERWSHRPGRSSMPPFLAKAHATDLLLQLGEGGQAPPKLGSASLMPSLVALALALALAVSAYAAGAAAARRHVRLDGRAESDGARASLLSGAMGAH
ncbi:hypothetical protein KFE25_006877 [Diacronema lutheri]|nr:hypothetical protein KFE25_006877 [Diacronema lutheri]